MGADERDAVSESWSRWRAETDLEEYFTRWQRLEATGASPHGEADLIASLGPTSVLDAGCGMGRVAIELDRRGIDVVGIDLDEDLLEFARRSASSVRWVHADLATMDLGRRFDVVAMPGNVMVFCRPSDRGRIISSAGHHLDSGGWLVAGFELRRGPDELTLAEYDRLCFSSGFVLDRRCSTWEGAEYRDGAYAVSIHRQE